MSPASLLLKSILNFILLLSCAKAHGRQMRVERLAKGYPEVVFGGKNPPWVEKRWAWERRWFWGIYPVLAAAILGIRFFRGTADTLSMGLGLLWAFDTDLALMGVVSALRLWKDWNSKKDEIQGRLGKNWFRKMAWGSLAWWLLVLGLALALTGLPQWG